jgi:hypothetical protein
MAEDVFDFDSEHSWQSSRFIPMGEMINLNASDKDGRDD